MHGSPACLSTTMPGSTFGELFRVTNFGESHGPAIGCVIDGCPPGMALSEADIQPELDRRRPGTSRHVTQRNEADAVEILSGVYEGLTTGTPICLLIRNTDQRSKDYGNILDTFRPGHADYTYWRKYGLRDPRGGGRSSARLTAPTVAAGAVAASGCSAQHGTTFTGWMSALGEIEIPFEDEAAHPAQPLLRAQRRHRAAARGVHGRAAQGRRFLRRAHRGARTRHAGGPGRAAVRQARRRHRLRDDGPQRRQGRGDRRRLRQRRAAWQRRTATSSRPRAFAGNHAGGVLGGISTGQDLVVRIAIKPTSSIRTPRASIDRAGQPTTVETFGRHDPCVGIRATPIAEALLALVVMDHALRHRAQCGDVLLPLPPIAAAAARRRMTAARPPLARALQRASGSPTSLPIGLFNPYAPLWFQDLGFSTLAIGAIASLQSWTRIVAPYGWGWLGDHGGRRVWLIRWACAAAAAGGGRACCGARRLYRGGPGAPCCCSWPTVASCRCPRPRCPATSPPAQRHGHGALRPRARVGLGGFHRRGDGRRRRAAAASASALFPWLVLGLFGAAAGRGAAAAGHA